MPNELTNPNNVVTEERLAQFYQQILPYLGGMPDVLANKFNRADLYSTDEKLIGRWIDGKPLYQKSMKIDNPSSTSTYVTAFAVQNLGALVKAEGIAVRSEGSIYAFNGGIRPEVPSNYQYSVSVRYFNGNIEYLVGNYNNVSTLYVTIQYTKTTDSAVEIGSDTDYSTTEKIVGTWIDGKPLYQKTVSFTGLSARSYEADITSLNVETPIQVISTVTSNNKLFAEYDTSPRSGKYGYTVGFNDTQVTFSIGDSFTVPVDAIVTLRYTKTSS